jgi:GrpB-like predicted nucleotidyltransferase (UPF0157 family)
VRLLPADPRWIAIADELAADIRALLGGSVRAVEHIGSTSVPGLLAKPIVDLVLGVRPGPTVEEIADGLSRLRWIYRDDAGDAGGWVFVMEDAPWHRVAHAHGVEFGGPHWIRYLHLRDLLRQSVAARSTYEQTKERLVPEHPDGRHLYTAGKGPTVEALLAENK